MTAQSHPTSRKSALDQPAGLILRYGPAAFILTLPLEFTSVYLRQQLSRFVLAVVVIAFAYVLLTRRRSLQVPRSASAGMLALCLLASLASWSISRAPGSLNQLLDVVLYPAVALLLCNLVATESDHRLAWIAFLISALAVATLGAFLYETHLSIWTPNRLVAARLNITFGDPNITARFLTVGAAAAIVMFAGRKAPGWLCVATAVACAVVLPLTLSRSGLALFVVTAALAVIVAFQRRRAALLAAITVVAFGVSAAVNPVTLQRAEDAAATVVSAIDGKPFSISHGNGVAASTQYAADDNRVYLIRAGLAMFQHHPLTGVGFGGYQHALLTTYRSYVPANLNPANLDTLSHASIVTVMAEQGAIGTVVLIAFLVLLGIEAFRARRRDGPWAAWATLPAAMIIPIFVYSQIEGRLITEPYFWLSVGLLYSALMRQREEAAQEESAVTTARSEPARRVELA